VYYTEQFREAANVADRAATLTIAGYRDQTLPYETNITDGPALFLRTALHGEISGLSCSARVMKSASGSGADGPFSDYCDHIIEFVSSCRGGQILGFGQYSSLSACIAFTQNLFSL
jgi:hypothetical protein